MTGRNQHRAPPSFLLADLSKPGLSWICNGHHRSSRGSTKQTRAVSQSQSNPPPLLSGPSLSGLAAYQFIRLIPVSQSIPSHPTHPVI